MKNLANTRPFSLSVRLNGHARFKRGDFLTLLPAIFQHQGSGNLFRGAKGSLYWSCPQNSFQGLGMEQPILQLLKNLNPFPSPTELLSSSLTSFWGLTPGNNGLLQCEEGLQPPASLVEDVLGLEGVILQDGVHLQELGVVPTMLLDHLTKVIGRLSTGVV